jgi:hypothetical protein
MPDDADAVHPRASCRACGHILATLSAPSGTRAAVRSEEVPRYVPRWQSAT